MAVTAPQLQLSESAVRLYKHSKLVCGVSDACDRKNFQQGAIISLSTISK